MEKLDRFLDEHYLPEKKKEICDLLEKYELFQSLKQITTEVKLRLPRVGTALDLAHFSTLATASGNFLTLCNSRISTVENPEEKQVVQWILADIGQRMILSLLRSFPGEAVGVLKAISASLELTCAINGYELNDLQEKLNLEELIRNVNSISGQQQAESLVNVTNMKSGQIEWAADFPLDYFLHELEQLKWIRSKRKFGKLFGNKYVEEKVEWDGNRLKELSFLLFQLHENNCIITSPTKGHFSIPERRIIDFEGKNLKRGCLRRLSSKINKEMTRYQYVVKSVMELLSRAKIALRTNGGLLMDNKQTMSVKVLAASEKNLNFMED